MSSAKAAAASQNPAIALLAVSAQLDVFTKIKEEIDKLIGEMEAQQADEVEHRDFCIKSLNELRRASSRTRKFWQTSIPRSFSRSQTP